MADVSTFYYVRTNRHSVDLTGYDLFKNYNLGIS